MVFVAVSEGIRGEPQVCVCVCVYVCVYVCVCTVFCCITLSVRFFKESGCCSFRGT